MCCNAERHQPDAMVRGVPGVQQQSSAVVTCKRIYLVQRAEQRGWLLEEVRECIVDEQDDVVRVDTNHPAYPAKARPVDPTAIGRPGTILKHWLTAVRFKVTPNCRCNDRANIMDARGCDWCATNVPTIVEWLREEAAKRRLPFVGWAATLLVRRAIAVARREANNAT